MRLRIGRVMRRRGARHARHLAATATALLLLAMGLQIVPSRPGRSEAAASEQRVVSIYEEPRAVDVPELTDAQHEPPDAPYPYSGVTDPAVTALDFGEGTSPAELVQGEIPLPEEGGMNADAYTTEVGVGEHLRAISADIFNVEQPNGEWVDGSLVPVDEGQGWSASGPGYAVRFPKVLSATARVSLELADGSISQVPSGIAPTQGVLEGAQIRYADALASTDLVYEVVPGGFKERVIFKDPSAATAISWQVWADGLSLAQSTEGAIQIIGPNGLLSESPPASATDSSSPVRRTTGQYTLDDLGGGSYLVSASLDPAFLEQATFPIRLDPGTTTVGQPTDTYVNANQPNNSFGSNTRLRTGPSDQYRAFISFPTDWKDPNLLVWSAELRIFPASGSSTLTVRRMADSWWNGTTWADNRQASNTPDPVLASGPSSDWWGIQLKDLYQRYNDGEYPDYGVELTSPDTLKFCSRDATQDTQCTPQNSAPYLFLSFDNIPNTPSPSGPDDGKAFDDDPTPTLKIGQIPNDADGDEVLVRFQVKEPAQTWSDAKDSGWIDESKFTIPSGWLKPGAQYQWRVQSADVCSQPTTLCDRHDGTGALHPWNASAARSLSIATKNWGEDSRYAMWSQDAGNGITLSVNESNGNMYLQAPIDQLRTPLGKLRIGLSYNSQSAAAGNDNGLGPGWRLYAGPTSSGNKTPIEIEQLTPTPYSGVKVTLRSGRRDTYAWRGGTLEPGACGESYSNVGSDVVIRQNADCTFTMRSSGGDVFTFDQQGKLSKAKPVYSKPKAAQSGAVYSYAYDQDRLTSVTDPLGRQVLFTWTDFGGTKRLTRISTWAGASSFWTIQYQGGHVWKITDPESQTARFYYGADQQSDLIVEVRNAEQLGAEDPLGDPTPDRGPGWRIEYFKDTAAPTSYQIFRVQRLYPPQANGGTVHWLLTYGSGPSDYAGYASLQTILTDPRGIGTDPPDYETRISFNTQGLPIEIRAPKTIASGPNVEPDAVTRMVWDSSGKLQCTRSPQANALGAGCQGSDTTGQYNTVYTYGSKEPYRLLEVKGPAPDGAGARGVTTYEYDAGGTFWGLWVEEFENANMAGVPADEGLWSDLTRDWGTGSPSGIDDPEQWSLRLSGYLDMDAINGQAKTYEFKASTDDGITLVVGSQVLLNCFGLEKATQFTGDNCGASSPPSKKLWPNRTPIVIEYQEKTGSAKLDLRWREKGQSTWEEIDPQVLVPNLGLLTKKTQGHDGTGTNLTLQTQWAYANDLSKMLRLPDWKEMSDLGAGAGLEKTRRTTFTYDDYGRRSTITRYAGTNFAGTTTRAYDDTGGRSCLQRTTSQVSLTEDIITTTFDCDKTGDVTSETLQMRAKSIDGVQLESGVDRVSSTTYDLLGRVLRIDGSDGGATTYAYDRSGRLIQQSVLLVDVDRSLPEDGTWASAATDYNDYYQDPQTLAYYPRIIETRPEGVQVTHVYDWIGNEVSVTDPRNAELAKSWAWTTEYDAQNRVIYAYTPDPDGAGPLEPLLTQTRYSIEPFQTSVIDPSGVTSVAVMDMLGRTIQQQSGGTAPTYTSYDKVGNVSRVEQSSGGTVYSWAQHTYNAYGQVLTDSFPWKDDANGGVIRQVTTSYIYNAAGWLKQLDGPLGYDWPGGTQQQDASENDLIGYEYDLQGRITRANYWVSETQSYETLVSYNDAGEQLQVKSQLDNEKQRYQVRDWTYTPAGLVASYIEPHGGGLTYTTSNAYDEGGRLRTTQDPRGCTLSFSYDLLSRLTDRAASGSGCAGSEQFTYWADGSQHTAVQKSVSPNITVESSFDFMGRPQTVTTGTDATSYAYEEGTGRLASVATAAGTTYYSYCADNTGGCYLGLLDTVDEPLLAGITDYSYDAAGRPVQRTDSNNAWTLTWTRAYEPETARVDTQTIRKGSNTLGDFGLDYDEAGNVISRREYVGSDPRNGTWSYSYDAASRMTSAAGPDPTDTTSPVSTLTWTYGYDGAGNRTSSSTPNAQGAITYTTDDQGWPTADDNGTPSVLTDDTSYGWDQAGDLEKIDRDGTGTGTNDWRFTYDAWGRTVRADKGPEGAPSLSVAYTVDALGRMISRSAGTSSASLTYQGTSETLATSTESSVTTRYTYTPGGVLAQRVGTGPVQVLLRDLHGDIVGAVSPGSGQTASQDFYSAFGERTGSSSKLGFQGQYTDPDTSEVDTATRMYVPGLGRFSTRDSLFGELTRPLSLNQFGYSSANPITLSDPTGLMGGGLGAGCAGFASPSCVAESDPVTQFVGGMVLGGWNIARETGKEVGGFLVCPICSTVGHGSKFVSDVHKYGVLDAANTNFNPAYWMLEHGRATIEALKRGHYYEAGENFTYTAADAGATIAIAYGGAKVASGRLGLGAGEAADSGIVKLPAEETWGRPETLTRHFVDHGPDFGAATEGEYAQMASEFLQRGLREGLPTKIDANGVIRIYDPATNTFGAYKANGTTATFFKPATNWSYWLSQPGAAPIQVPHQAL